MKNMILQTATRCLFSLIVLTLTSVFVMGQNMPKTLIIKKKQVYEVGPTNSLILDTLIMEDKATLQFAPNATGTLIVKTAIIGKDCLISAKGKMDFDGENGGNLAITAHFASLISLTIDTSGGNGQRGKNGRNGKDGTPDKIIRTTRPDSKGNPMVITEVIPGIEATPGTPGTPGGKAGNGGDISLTYGSNNFIINFNNSKSKNNIALETSAGIFGRHGKAGRPGRSYNWAPAVDETKTPLETQEDKPQNGKVTLAKLSATLVSTE